MIYIRIAGIINFLTALIHLGAGQFDLVYPLWQTTLTNQQKGEWTAVWHMVSVLLLGTTVVILKSGFKGLKKEEQSLLNAIGILYMIMALPFIVSSLYARVFAPQWILLLPIGLLTLWGVRKESG